MYLRRTVVVLATATTALMALPATAHAGPALGCKTASGTEIVQFTSATSSSGTIIGPPLIAGTTTFSITSVGSTGTTYTGELVDTTANGILATRDYGISRVDGTFAEAGAIDPSASSGVFHTAVGAIVFDGAATTPGAFTSSVHVIVCP
jgi:hypothetical protein